MFMEWKGKTGTLSFYNKEKEASVEVPLPFDFLVLDELNKVSGYNRQMESGYYSNEVRNTLKEPLTVRMKGGIVEEGLYRDLQVLRKGAKFAKSVYIAFQSPKTGQWGIGNITMTGSSWTAWVEFGKHHKVQNGKVRLAKKGDKMEAETGDYYPPVFEYLAATPEEDAEAIRLDKELQIFLSQYLSAPRVDTEPEDDTPDAFATTSTDQRTDIDTTAPPKKAERTEMQTNKGAGDLPDPFEDAEPVNLDDIPF